MQITVKKIKNKHKAIRNTKMKAYKNIWPLLIGVVVLVLSAGVMFAWFPDSPEDGRSIARTIYAKMTNPNQQGACRLSYTVTTNTVVEDDINTTVAEIEYLASTSRMHLISDQVQVYQDTTYVITIAPSRKQIFLAPSNRKSLSERRQSMTTSVRDSLFDSGYVVEYSSVDDVPNSEKKLVMQTAESLQCLTMIDTVSIWMNPKDQSLQKISLQYIENSAVHSVDVEYHEVDFVDSLDEFSQPLLSIIFQADGSLRPELKDYRINDMRSSKE